MKMDVHSFYLRHNCGKDMELHITNNLSHQGIIIPLSEKEREDLVRELKFGEE